MQTVKSKSIDGHNEMLPGEAVRVLSFDESEGDGLGSRQSTASWRGNICGKTLHVGCADEA